MTSKKETKKTTKKVAYKRDKNLEVAKIIVSVQSSDRFPIHWDGLNDKFYNFAYDPVYKKHTIEFDSIEQYEAERNDLIHSANGRAIGHFGFQVHIITVAQQEEIDKKRKLHDKKMAERQKQLAKAQEEVEEEVNEAEKQLEEAREKLGAVQLKSTSLNIG
jgi:multidrug efflux pump subunit AcrA (membrane-fusion protein)